MQNRPDGGPQTTTLSRRDQAREQRPKEIINAAFEEFRRKGYAAARLEDVARRVGVAKGTIYLYFANKEELFRAVVRSLVEPGLERAAELSAHFEGDTAELLRINIENFYKEILEYNGPGLLRMLLAESPKFPELTEVYFREVIERGDKLLSDIIKRGIARGEFRADAPTDFPQLVTAPVMMLSLHRELFGERHGTDINAYMKAHIDFLLAGLRAAPERSRSGH